MVANTDALMFQLLLVLSVSRSRFARLNQGTVAGARGWNLGQDRPERCRVALVVRTGFTGHLGLQRHDDQACCQCAEGLV
jgi:hypothetical protein